MIAPFWADVDTNKGGAIWYRQNTTTHLLEVASIDVRNAFPEFPRFSAIWMFVATWEKVAFYGIKNKNIGNTFQVVLLTDGRYSFVRFNYHNIEWTSGTENGGNSYGLGGTEAVV
ncbi:Sushi, nidogen and EGF-like domain-containing protein 1 [Exaiptasia diaphana]|nr:Sushi, nidogen and EGF-like domain-containing protein 1 [Exaiptasia diaphana]